MRSKDDKNKHWAFSLVSLSLSLSQSERAVSQKNGSDEMFALIAFNSRSSDALEREALCGRCNYIQS